MPQKILTVVCPYLKMKMKYYSERYSKIQAARAAKTAQLTGLVNVVGSVAERNDIIFVVIAAADNHVVIAAVIQDNRGSRPDDIAIDASFYREAGLSGGHWLVRVNDLFMCQEFVAVARGTMPARLIEQIHAAATVVTIRRAAERRDARKTEDLEVSRIWSDCLLARRPRADVTPL